MAQPSPYTPGIVARWVPGRAPELAFFGERAQFIGGLGRFAGRITVYQAARGVGKTSLLRQAQLIFQQHGVQTLWVTANESENLLETILRAMRDSLPAGQKAWQGVSESLDSLTVGVGSSGTGVKATLKRAGAPSSTATFKKALSAFAEAARSAGGTGVVLLIDEVQSADKPSLRALAHAWQEFASEPAALAAGLFAVGLPGSQEYLAKAVTFSERFAFHPLPDLGDAGVAEALRAPAEAIGVSWQPDALNLAIKEASGYPYKVQLIGDEVWRAARFPDAGAVIGEQHLRAALPEVDRQMSALHGARWRAASTRQRALLVAVAELGGVSVKRDEIAKLMGTTTGAISGVRDRLLRAGVIAASDHGRLSFTVPGFTEYVLRHRD